MPMTPEHTIEDAKLVPESPSTGLAVIKLNRFLPIEPMGEDSRQFALDNGTRWDVTQGERKPDQDDDDDELYVQNAKGEWVIWPHDMRDVRGRFYRTRPDAQGNQGSTAGRLLTQDFLMGSASSATGLLFAAVPLFSLLIVLLSNSALAILPVMALLATLSLLAISTGGWAIVAAVGAALPLVALALPEPSQLHDPTSFLGSSKFFIPVGVVLGMAFLFGSLRHARLVVGGLLAVGVVLGLSIILPDILRPLVLALPSAWCGTLWSSSLMSQRAAHLQWQKKVASWEDSANGTFHIEARRAQLLNIIN
ncbi:MAG: hypothetical protein RSP_17810 [Rhodanobacter sp.]